MFLTSRVMIVLIVIFVALIGSVIAISILASGEDEVFEIEEGENDSYGNYDEEWKWKRNCMF